MLDPVRHALLAALDGRDLSEDEAAAAIGEMMDGQTDAVLVASFLTALRAKGETAAELYGAARAMRERAAKIPARVSGLLDTCGTGGDGLATFNISTATAIVAAAAGVPVAKHGNRAASSTSGSADVLEALGVNINLTPEDVATCIDEAGIGFCFAPLCHGAMKNVAPIRKTLGFRTIFNLLGPLTNPAGADFQLVGASRIATAEKLAQALALFGVKRAVVVCGNDELDEVSLWGTTTAFIVENGRMERTAWDAGELAGGKMVSLEELRVSSPGESAARIQAILAGESSSGSDIVAANAAAALLAAGRVTNIHDGLALARDTIASGAAQRTLAKLAEVAGQLARK
ncbi:MAG: anthranilate phosphoribosyltransferase [Planctomycetota bacterium]|nr:anthranilate phosphoribosyltransferase [Planctomycetaceae bacterium]MDQ3333381.1 anthranilate phosphoribosyltransferase [Planctomycetota bacterium]